MVAALVLVSALPATTARATEASVGARPTPPDPGKWQLSLDREPDSSARITAVLPAEAPIPSGFDQVTPKLVLRFRAGRTTAYVIFDTFLGEGTLPAKVRFGDQPPEAQAWRISSDGRGAFVPGDALAFIDRLKAVARLTVTATPAKRPPFTATFSTKGTDVVVKVLLSAAVR